LPLAKAGGNEALGQPEESTPGEPEGAIRGDSEIHQPGPEDEGCGATRILIIGDTEGLKFGATWRSVNRHRRRMRGSRRLGAPSPAKPEVQGNWGNPGACIGGDLKGGDARGNPKPANRDRGRMRDSGRLEDPLPAQPKDRRFGATRNFVAGAAAGCVQGQPGDAARPSWKMLDTGQPGASIAGLNGTMHDPMN